MALWVVAALPALLVVLSVYPFAVPPSVVVQSAGAPPPSLFELYVAFGRKHLGVNYNVAFAVGANACETAVADCTRALFV